MHARAKACAAISLVTFVAGQRRDLQRIHTRSLPCAHCGDVSHRRRTVLSGRTGATGSHRGMGSECKPWISDSNRGGISISGPIARFFLAGGENACEVLRKRTVNLGSDDTTPYAFASKDWVEPGRGGGGRAVQLCSARGPPVGLFVHARRMDVVVLAASALARLQRPCSGLPGPGAVQQHEGRGAGNCNPRRHALGRMARARRSRSLGDGFERNGGCGTRSREHGVGPHVPRLRSAHDAVGSLLSSR